MGTSATPELPVESFPDARAFEEWLVAQGDGCPGVWLRIAKKGSGLTSVSYDEALEVALCHGWIDGQKRGYDDRSWLQRFTPRRRGSRWSRINRDKATALVESGRMSPAGLREVEAAKADGRWDAAYAGQRTATVPADLQAALDASPAAAEFFATLSSANRYAILYRIGDARRPQTRARRIAEFVRMLEEQRTLHP